jgi:hypothetical protein
MSSRRRRPINTFRECINGWKGLERDSKRMTGVLGSPRISLHSASEFMSSIALVSPLTCRVSGVDCLTDMAQDMSNLLGISDPNLP